MVFDRSLKAVATAVGELRRVQDDPQAVLTSLVQLHNALASASSSATRSLPMGPSLRETARLLQDVLLRFIHEEEEIVWYLCRVVAVWGRACHRMQHECGHIRMWSALQMARGRFSESPRVIEASLEATIALLHRVELHQLIGSHDQSHDKLTDELVALLDRFDEPPARLILLSPHYDWSTIIVLALEALRELFTSSKVASTAAHIPAELFTRTTVPRMLKMLPHFLKTERATRTWLAMARLQLQYSPMLAFQMLFLEPQASRSWCHQVLNEWRDSHCVVYDFTALYTQIFAVPHGSNALPLNLPTGDVAHAVMVKHDLLPLMTELLDANSNRLRKEKPSKLECEHWLPVLVEIARCLRQWSSIPEFLGHFPTSRAAKDTLITLVTSELESCHATIRLNEDPTTTQTHKRLQLELLLLLKQLSRSPPLARIIQSTETLQPVLAKISKQATTNAATAKRPSPEDLGDSELPAVLAREAKNTIAAVNSLQPPTRTFSSTTRKLQRLPSSSTLNRSSSNSRAIKTTSTVRREPSTASLVRTNSQTRN